jgi:hypothetical protein
MILIMTVKAWLEFALQDADRRGLPALRPLLEGLARATSALRSADWNADAGVDTVAASPGHEC